MKNKADSVFKITGWDEETVTEIEGGGKLTRAHITTSYTGDFEGEGELEYVMMYREDGSADFVGYESVTASIEGKRGTFVFEQRGHFRDGVATSTWHIVEDSGSGSLAGIKGKVEFSEGHKEQYEIELNYEF